MTSEEAVEVVGGAIAAEFPFLKVFDGVPIGCGPAWHQATADDYRKMARAALRTVRGLQLEVLQALFDD